MRNNSIVSRDIKDGKDGASGPTPTTMSWQISYVGGSSNSANGVSQMTIPAYTKVTGIDLTADGGLTGCSAYPSFSVQAAGGFLARSNASGSSILDQLIVGRAPTTLQWYASCDQSGFGSGILPAFTATVTFETIKIDPTSTADFN